MGGALVCQLVIASELQNLSYDKCMERRLVVPDLGVKFVAAQTQRGLCELEPFIGSDLHSGAQRKKRLKPGIERKQHGKNENTAGEAEDGCNAVAPGRR